MLRAVDDGGGGRSRRATNRRRRRHSKKLTPPHVLPPVSAPEAPDFTAPSASVRGIIPRPRARIIYDQKIRLHHAIPLVDLPPRGLARRFRDRGGLAAVS